MMDNENQSSDWVTLSHAVLGETQPEDKCKRDFLERASIAAMQGMISGPNSDDEVAYATYGRVSVLYALALWDELEKVK